MGHKIFVSYKYSDNSVLPLPGKVWQNQSFVWEYVARFRDQIEQRGTSIYKGEHDNEDLSGCSEEYIWGKLKDKIYDSSVTVLFISPRMKNALLPDQSQWIPWEIAYSLRETTRSDRTSHPNAIVAVILPDSTGGYGYYSIIPRFKIVDANIANGYIERVNWNDFISNTTKYIEAALKNRDKIPPNDIVKTV